ncbi:MAG TPA: SNF2-related protein [Solirubrobacteraceae bacterium]|nr:SNF2-related protein [Solirubrobacteraceae bacterium]
MTSFLALNVDARQPRLDTDTTAQDAFAAAASTASGRDLGLTRLAGGARDEIYAAARTSAAGIQIQRAFAGWTAAISNMHSTAIRRLAADKPVDPNTPATWASVDAHAQAVLRRHLIADVQTKRLADQAVHALIRGQADADLAAGLDWSIVHPDPAALDEQLAAARRTLPIDLTDPRSWAFPQDQRAALARRTGVHGDDVGDLSRWVLANPDDFGPDTLRSWRIGSKHWMRIASGRLDPVGDVARPVGVFLAPHIKAGWCLMPCLSLDMIRLVIELGGSIDHSLRRATLPADSAGALLKRMNPAVLHAGSTELIENLGDLSKALTDAFGQTVSAMSSTDKRDRWGRIHVTRQRWSAKGQAAREQLALDVLTFTTRGFAAKRFGAVRASSTSASLALELGEAVGIAIDGGVPLLLSSEAAGDLGDTVRIGTMSGRPGMVTITSSDGVAAVTERLVAEQAVNRVRKMQTDGVDARVDARAKRILRMTAAQPLAADPVLLAPQRRLAAQMAVGSGLNASDVGTGKTITTARGALYQRAATTRAMRGLVVADGRLVKQWLRALTHGAPDRGMPALLPNAVVVVADERTPVAAQVRAFHRTCARGAGVMIVSDSIMERHGGDLALINWHVLIADEADRYANAATEAHKALMALRSTAVLDCWLLTATPKGRNREDLDVLVGIAIGDHTMIRDRVATRESGDLMDERNSHRLRRDYGAHLARITESEMAQYKPKIRKAKAIVVQPDGRRSAKAARTPTASCCGCSRTSRPWRKAARCTRPRSSTSRIARALCSGT